MTQDEFEVRCRKFVAELQVDLGELDSITVAIAFGSKDHHDMWNTMNFSDGDMRPNYGIIAQIRNHLRNRLLTLPDGMEIVTGLDMNAIAAEADSAPPK